MYRLVEKDDSTKINTVSDDTLESSRGDLFTRQLIQEKQRITNLQSQFKQVNDKMANLRNANKAMAMELLNEFTTTPKNACHRVDGINPARLAEANQKKIVKNLESRLGKSKECMEKELMTIQADMDNILKRAAVASDEREKLMDQRNQILVENKLRQAPFEKDLTPPTSAIDSVDDTRQLQEKLAALDKQYADTQRSPKTFERAIANATNLRLHTDQVNLNEQSDESDEDVGSSFTSSDDDDDGRPMSVHDMRRQAAEFIKSSESATWPKVRITSQANNNEKKYELASFLNLIRRAPI
ncbi:hypothetical protein HJC23_001853 [Cyclotella cryptica]|uniref:Uncharacterized protein n=1 Tax=Cyclotella cryptica TaxID=29204 RepID=A0ABD3PZ94_9STRA